MMIVINGTTLKRNLRRNPNARWIEATATATIPLRTPVRGPS